MLAREVPIPMMVAVLPSATRTAEVLADVRTFLRRWRNEVLRTEIWAPVSMRAGTGTLSTRALIKLLRGAMVETQLAVRVGNTAPRAGAAFPSFPSRGLGTLGTSCGEE